MSGMNPNNNAPQGSSMPYNPSESQAPVNWNNFQNPTTSNNWFDQQQQQQQQHQQYQQHLEAHSAVQNNQQITGYPPQNGRSVNYRQPQNNINYQQSPISTTKTMPAQPFQASNAFANTNNNNNNNSIDGWDNWDDWNDGANNRNSNATSMPLNPTTLSPQALFNQPPQKQQLQHPPPPPRPHSEKSPFENVSTSNQQDYNNRNFLTNTAPQQTPMQRPPPLQQQHLQQIPQQPLSIHQQQQHSPLQQQQQQPPPQQQQQQPPPLPSFKTYNGPFQNFQSKTFPQNTYQLPAQHMMQLPMSQSTSISQPIQSHSPMLISVQQPVQQPLQQLQPQQTVQQPMQIHQMQAPFNPYNQAETATHTINDSFNATDDNWSWSKPETKTSQQSGPKKEIQNIEKITHAEQNTTKAFEENLNDFQYQRYDASPFSIPDTINNTPRIVPHMQVAKLKNETLSPQWSIESQVSQTSSEHSNESERSSNTVTSDEGIHGHRTLDVDIENNESTDRLDETLQSLNLNQEKTKREEPVRESSFPPPPPSISQVENATPIVKSSSRTPPLPPPPTEPLLPPPSAKATKETGHSLNPYKRKGNVAHHAPLIAPAPTPPSTSFFYPQNTLEIATNIENPTPENLERPDSKLEYVENLEVAPSNDRNQYLQTGHLSEDGYNIMLHESPADLNDNLPPPGLSRFVLGQQKPENQQNNSNNFPEPPPGLDRMIPGTDLDNETDLNIERQADGEVSDAGQSTVRSSFVLQPDVIHQNNILNINDRNYYTVPGESTSHSTQQRVIPGVEHERSSNPFVQNHSQEINMIPINEQQRELVMDGENLQDNPQLPEIITRDEPLEGGNTVDESIVINQEETDSNILVDNPRKEPSNTSTCDESDKDRKAFYKKSGKGEDYSYQRQVKNKSRERYDSEEDSDYSDREKKHREAAVVGDRRRDTRDKDRRKDGSGRDRDYNRGELRDKDKDRNRYDRDRDRYNRHKHDRDSKYETDGSKYETERSTRYDKDGKRYKDRDDYYRRDERDERDRRYRKDRGERDDRRNDDRYRDGRGDKRRDQRGRYEYDDAYYRTASRNDRDRERLRDNKERDPKVSERKHAYGYGATGYNYDAYAYYAQHQQYYEQLRRTNPQAYAEWYRTYYSQIQTMQQRDPLITDGRESVHSGRSSANDKDRYSRSVPPFYNPDDYHRSFNQTHSSAILDQSFMSETSGQMSSLPMYAPSMSRRTPVAMDRSYLSESGYYQQRVEMPDSSIVENKIVEPERLTPFRFNLPHSIASLSCGILVSMKPKYSSNGLDVVKIFNLGANDATKKLFHTYPGPLVREFTHKKSIIEFCEDQLRLGPTGHVKSRRNSVTSLSSIGNFNRGSFTLLWNYLILLLRQNGTFDGTAISELLMKNKEEFPFESLNSSIKSGNASGRNSSLSNNERRNIENRSVDEISHKSEDDDDKAVEKSELTETEITNKFRNYLIYGDISKALDYATENNLWGHALFLASKVDRRQHANVMIKFANKLPLNDPLQTLYQLMSGRTPASVTSILDEKWGDWRPHLAMLMSNSSEKPELIKKSITTLGDSLHNRGDLYGSHFCYLLSDVTFGKYSNVKQESSLMSTSANAVRLILLGSSHHKSFNDFATNEAIMMTEIYEYARSLNGNNFTIKELQYYKYLMATRMLDYGMQLKCLLYMEQIAQTIEENSHEYETEFMQKIYTLGDRLKYYDPVMEKALDESVDNMGHGNIYATVDDPRWLQNLRSIINNHNNGASNYDHSITSQTQNYDSSLEYNQYNSHVDTVTQLQTNKFEQHQQQKQQQPDINQEFVEINQQFSQLNLQYNEPYESEQIQVSTAQPTDHQYTQNSLHHINSYQHPEEPQAPAPVPVENISFNPQVNTYNPNSYVTGPISSTDSAPSYDYWNQAPQQQHQPEQQANNEIPKPTIRMPNSMSNRAGFDDDMDKENQAKPKTTPDHQANRQGADKHLSLGKDKGSQNANSGWFGGIWNKLSLKPKNQMILPDDKNPTIVWDPEKKKWVNTDGDGAGAEESFKPPPKMTELPNMNNHVQSIPVPMNQTLIPEPAPTPAQPMMAPTHAPIPMQSNNVNAPKAVVEPTKVPTLQSNVYQRQRNRTLKNSYVDVFNPSRAPPRAQEMAPALPDMTIPSALFVPGQIPATKDSQQEGAPQFYNPNQFSGYQQ